MPGRRSFGGKQIMNKLSKISNLFKKYCISCITKGPLFVHLSPLTSCNLKCEYCYQIDETHDLMSIELFKKVLNQCIKLNVGIIAFTGGEPLLWQPLENALMLCKKVGIFTQITTNGFLLNKNKIDELANCGLDMLSISIDGYDKLFYSSKTISNNSQAFEILCYAKERYGIIVSTNMVLTLNNIDQLNKLTDYAHHYKIPQSIGLYVPPPNKENNFSYNFTDLKNIQEAIKSIVDKKARGYDILDPSMYYEKYISFLKGQYSWDCNIAKKRTLQIGPDGSVYWCTKLCEKSPYNIMEMNLATYLQLKSKLSEIIKFCNNN